MHPESGGVKSYASPARAYVAKDHGGDRDIGLFVSEWVLWAALYKYFDKKFGW